MTSLDASSSIEQIAATVSNALTAAGITAVLSGGAAVQIYSSGLYVSRDLDFVSSASHREIEVVLRELIREWATHPVGSSSIQILTPTQCVMDRLAAFYHWRDRQALDQAVAVASVHPVDLDEIRRWSVMEGQEPAHQEFARALKLSMTGSAD